MAHPNQMALPIAVDRWIQQAQHLPKDIAIARLSRRIRMLQDKIHEFSVASAEDREPDESVAGLSVIDLMAAQSRLIVERAVTARLPDMAVAA